MTPINLPVVQSVQQRSAGIITVNSREKFRSRKRVRTGTQPIFPRLVSIHRDNDVLNGNLGFHVGDRLKFSNTVQIKAGVTLRYFQRVVKIRKVPKSRYFLADSTAVDLPEAKWAALLAVILQQR